MSRSSICGAAPPRLTWIKAGPVRPPMMALERTRGCKFMPNSSRRRRVVILGAAGRDFHNFNTVYRDDLSAEVVAFTAAQIPGISGRRYPPELSGRGYPNGIPIVAEVGLEALISERSVDEVVFAYSDVRHDEVMHLASRSLAGGPGFALLGPERTMLRAAVPVIAVSAVRTGCGKSQVPRYLAKRLRGRGLRVVVIRHPMPYGDLAAARVQRFAARRDLDAAACTIEEREEYEPHLAAGNVVFAGVDYGEIVARAQGEADLILWDGGNNDFPFLRPDLHIVLVDALRPGHETSYHPGEAVLRMADIVLVAKADAAPAGVARIAESVRAANARARLVRGGSPVTLDDAAAVRGKRVIAVEDGPTVTHGGMPHGAAWAAAREAGAASIVNPRPWAAPDIAPIYARYPQHRAGPAGDGLFEPPNCGAGRNPQRGRCRFHRRRHARRSGRADDAQQADHPCALRVRGTRAIGSVGGHRGVSRPPEEADMKVVIALGGNALLKRGEPMEAEVQRRNVTAAAEAIARIARRHSVVVTHGNGPQVRLLALQAESYALVQPYPLDMLGAQSEGLIGYLIEQELMRCLPQRAVVTLLTQVVVKSDDLAFKHPAKPIGPVYSEKDARQVAAARGWMMAQDGSSWRRVAPSPEPLRIVELAAIRMLVDAGAVVVCAGGGGIPVVLMPDGAVRGVEAVIDKDLSAALLAQQLGATALLLLTDVDAVYLKWGTNRPEPIREAVPGQLHQHVFAAGSMGPKVEAACRFVENGGQMAGIGRLEDAERILEGTAGTAVRQVSAAKT